MRFLEVLGTIVFAVVLFVGSMRTYDFIFRSRSQPENKKDENGKG